MASDKAVMARCIADGLDGYIAKAGLRQIPREVHESLIADIAEALDRFATRARLEGEIAGAQAFGEHEDTYEGTCGIHMASNCSLCKWLACKRADLERLAGGRT